MRTLGGWISEKRRGLSLLDAQGNGFAEDEPTPPTTVMDDNDRGPLVPDDSPEGNEQTAGP